MGLLKNLWRGFRGGPDFSNSIEVTALLEEWRLDLTLPLSNVQAKMEPKTVNYPFNESGWFEAHSEQSRQHHFVHIETKIWYYMPNSPLLQTELGLFSLSVQLKRTLPNKNTNAMDLAALGRYVVAEYDEHYNAPTTGPQFQGENIRRTKMIEDRVRKMCGKNIKEEEIQAKIAIRLPPTPFPPIPPHDIRTIKGRDWVYCVEPIPNLYSQDRMYCQPLNESFYLCLRFRHRVDWSPKYKCWKDHAIAAEARIMEGLRLEKVNSTPLLE